jgi:hypothetical protein
MALLSVCVCVCVYVCVCGVCVCVCSCMFLCVCVCICICVSPLYTKLCAVLMQTPYVSSGLCVGRQLKKSVPNAEIVVRCILRHLYPITLENSLTFIMTDGDRQEDCSSINRARVEDSRII